MKFCVYQKFELKFKFIKFISFENQISMFNNNIAHIRGIINGEKNFCRRIYKKT
jgi:hypothetical protein